MTTGAIGKFKSSRPSSSRTARPAAQRPRPGSHQRSWASLRPRGLHRRPRHRQHSWSRTSTGRRSTSSTQRHSSPDLHDPRQPDPAQRRDRHAELRRRRPTTPRASTTAASRGSDQPRRRLPLRDAAKPHAGRGRRRRGLQPARQVRHRDRDRGGAVRLPDGALGPRPGHLRARGPSTTAFLVLKRSTRGSASGPRSSRPTRRSTGSISPARSMSAASRFASDACPPGKVTKPGEVFDLAANTLAALGNKAPENRGAGGRSEVEGRQLSGAGGNRQRLQRDPERRRQAVRRVLSVLRRGPVRQLDPVPDRGGRPAATGHPLDSVNRPTAATGSCPASCTPTRFRRSTSRPTCRRTRPTTRRWSRGAVEAPLAASRGHPFA